MSNTNNSPSTSSFATAAHWIAAAQPWQKAALAAAAAIATGIIWALLRSLGRLTRTKMHGLRDVDDPMDPFIAAVAVMATALSVDGMWKVFGALHLVTAARFISCGVLEASGFAFMRLARKDIQATPARPATKHVVIVWCIAILSGTLSAGASGNALEAAVRLAFPSLAVQLCHSWMLPVEAEITLTQRQKGRRAWRFVKANRRVQRARTRPSKWIAGQLLALESDRLAKRSLMTGDATAVLAASEKIATAEALAALGIASGAPDTHLAPKIEHAPRHRANRIKVSVRSRTEDEIRQAVIDANAQAIAEDRAPLSARQIAREVRIGQDRAREILKTLPAQS